MNNPIVTMKIKNGGVIKLELYPDDAPQSVRNFVSLTKKGFFDGLAFWRVEKDLLIQGGCSKNDGTGAIGYSIKGEFKSNGVENTRKFTKGTIGMARLTPDSGASNYFIVVTDTPQYDGNYAPFGRIIEGITEPERISRVKANNEGFFHRAVEQVFVDKITVETFGIDYPEPEKLPELSKEEMQVEVKRICKERGMSNEEITKLLSLYE
jgi:peptidyl-prolyl cis-trans isomerase B (cyclophilin B)